MGRGATTRPSGCPRRRGPRGGPRPAAGFHCTRRAWLRRGAARGRRSGARARCRRRCSGRAWWRAGRRRGRRARAGGRRAPRRRSRRAPRARRPGGGGPAGSGSRARGPTRRRRTGSSRGASGVAMSDSTGWLAAPPPLPSLRRGPEPARIGNVLVGTASWTEKTLVASRAFYPAGVTTAEQRLRYYTRHFPVVEVDATYYALPSLENARRWAERTPPDFVFGVKAYAALTQHPVEPLRLDRDLQSALPADLRRRKSVYMRDLPPDVLDQVWLRFRSALAPLESAGKLAYVLFQMPRWFVPSRESAAYLEHAAERFAGVRVAIEFRQQGWMTERRAPRTLDFLRGAGLVYVSVDEPQGTAASVPPLAAATSEALSVVRFHGRRVETWTKPGVSTTERFRYLYRPEELREWVGRIRDLAGKSRQVHVLMNNCYRQYGVENAKDLAGLLAAS